MNLSKFNQLSSSSRFSLIAIVVLGIGLVVAVTGSQQNQEQRSKASTSTSISYDAGSTYTVSPGSSISWNHTTGSQSNRIMIVSVSILDSGNHTVSSATYNGVSLQRVPGGATSCYSNCSAELWYLVNPTPGSHTVTVRLTGTASPGIVANCGTFYNVDPSSPIGSVVANSGSGSMANVNLNTTSTQTVVDIMNMANGGTISPYSGQTRMGNSSSYKYGANGSTSMQWNMNKSAMWVDIALALNQISVGGYPGTTGTYNPTNTPAYQPTPTSVPYQPTPTSVPYQPTPTATPYPPTPTSVPYQPTPTATPYPPTPTNVPYQPTPTNTPIPTPVPTYAPVATATPYPGAASLYFTLLLHGLGKGGDSVNPAGQGNMTPIHPQRVVNVDIYNAQNNLYFATQGTVVIDSATGYFKGTVDLGEGFVTGAYTIKVKTDQFLRTLVPGIQSVTAGELTQLPQTAMITGDINNDNVVNILDYNLLMGCYSDLSEAVDCAPGDEVRADLTDDGAVNQFDYNLFLRELTTKGGQ